MAKRTAPPSLHASTTPTTVSNTPNKPLNNRNSTLEANVAAQTHALTSSGVASHRDSSTSASPTDSSRKTRSSARLAEQAAQAAAAPPTPAPSNTTVGSGPSRKRKASARRTSDSTEAEHTSLAPAPAIATRPKRQKVAEKEKETEKPASTGPTQKKGGKTTANMSDNSQTPPNPGESSKATRSKSASSRRTSRGKKSTQETATPSSRPQRKTKTRSSNADSEVTMKDADMSDPEEDEPSQDNSNDGSEQDEQSREEDEEEDDDDDDDLGNDPFTSAFLNRAHPLGLTGAMRALSGLMMGMSSQLRDILTQLRQKDDPTVQLIALQELSQILLMSTEDTLSGQFSPDPYVKELVSLMQPPEFGEENPEIMVLACRCLAHLMDVLRGSVANVVYGGAVPVLCQKLLDIQYIDLAEQALSTLAVISVDFPASIVREGGLSACLTYLDFFPTSTQRKAVTTAANCCRNIPQDSFPVVRDVMPVLLNVLSSSDQKVVEQGCLCVSRMVDSFKNKPEKLEELLSPELLRAVLRLLLPGTTNLIGQNVHTQFLRVLATTARASPRLSVELLKMNVVDTLYQMLTGVSPPADTDDASTKIDSVVVMQALIHRPKEQISETLNVICELLPRTPESSSSFDRLVLSSLDEKPRALGASQTSSETRANLFQDCQTELKRFANVLLPTLTDAYSSTVNLSVRQKVLTGQLKIFHNIEPQIIEDSLRIVPYSSFLASILSQQDHPSLVIRALQIANMLCDKLPQIYQYQFQREGVMTEIKKLAETPLSADGERIRDSVKARESNNQTTQPRDEDEEMQSGDEDDHEGEPERIEEDDEDDDDDEDREDDRDDDDMSDSIDSGLSPQSLTDILPAHNLRDFITLRAQKFIEDQERGLGSEMHDKAIKILQNLQSLSGQISAAHSENPSGEGEELFSDLAVYFDNDALGSITSSELLNSGIIHVLLDILDPRKTDNDAIRASFLEAFMGSNNSTSNGTVSAVNTPFSILINKLQDLLSRAEHFEVITVNPGSPDVNRTNATSMLGKQIRLKLVAEDEDDVPKGYKMLMVSIHAICTFKALDDYLRPRISLSEQPRGRRTRDSLLAQLADPNRLRDRQMQLAAELAAERAALIARDQGPSTPTQASARQIVGTKKSPSTAGPANAPDVASNRRRSSRRHQQPPPSGMPPLEPPLRDPEESRDPLECADERQLTDDEEGEEQFPPQSIDDLDEDMSDDVAQPDPSAVNMEVASTGRVTARQEDGTRVATPQNSTPVPTPSAKPSTPSGTGVPATTGPSLASAGRPMSYAAAMAAIPQDWHIGFSVDDRPISSETTVYRAVHHNRQNEHDVNGRAIWSSIHTIKYKRVRGPPPAETGLTPPPEETTLTSSGMPASLDGNTTASTILRLLKILHELNADIEGILIAKSGEATLKAEPLSLFINTKLTAKLNRQMEEPLIVASNCLPSWSEDLARLFPFLFPFETRHLFLQSTSYGYSRSMMRWQNTQPSDDDRNDRRRDDRPMLGRLQRQKVRISRSRILESAVKVMELYGASPSMLEVEYFEEVGTGLGPTLEFYSTVSKEFAKKKLKLWRENESSESGEYSFGKLGLFPAPMSDEQAESESGKKLLHLFKMLGKFVARSMLDSRIIDISFNPTFFRIGDITGLSASLGAIKAVDGDLANSLLYLKKFADANTQSDQVNGGTPSEIQIKGARIEDLGLDFTLPGYPHISLVPNGHDNPVTIENVGDYVDKIIEFTIGKGVIRQIEAFRAGFSQVFPYTSLKAFTPNELVMLFGRVDEDWSIETLMDSIKADHGFNMDSKSVRNLLQVMSELTMPQRRDFLQFVTGSPKLPIGGFKGLTPMFTVVCKPSEAPYASDDYLPSVMTCVNYLKLPDYTDLDILRKRLFVATKEGQGAFHLS